MSIRKIWSEAFPLARQSVRMRHATVTTQQGAIFMKLSARNRLKGTIIEVTKGATTSHVRVDIGGAVIMAAITNEAVDELKLSKGQTAYAVVKASDVMIGID
jgi:molybdopterin-binding protein